MEEARAAAPPASRASRRTPPPMAGMMAPMFDPGLLVVTNGRRVVNIGGKIVAGPEKFESSVACFMFF